MILKILDILGRKRVIKDASDEDYMHRYYLLFKEKINAFDKDFTKPNIYIHRIFKSDVDGDPHDHPWNYCTIILAGGYWEWIPTTVPSGKKIEKKYWRGPGTILWRRAEELHRLEMPAPTLSLFFHGRRFREWGFQTKEGWIDRISYITNRNDSKCNWR